MALSPDSDVVVKLTVPAPTHTAESVDTLDTFDESDNGPKGVGTPTGTTTGPKVASTFSVSAGSGPLGPDVDSSEKKSTLNCCAWTALLVTNPEVVNVADTVKVADWNVPSVGSNRGRFEAKFTSVADSGCVTHTGAVVAAEAGAAEQSMMAVEPAEIATAARHTRERRAGKS